MTGWRRNLVIAIAAVAGLFLAAALTTAASTLSGQSIGLSSEPLSAGRGLAPAETEEPEPTRTATPRPTRTPRPRRTATPAPDPTAAPTSAPTVDDDEDNSGPGGGGDDDDSGRGRGRGRGRGGDDD